MSKKNQKYSAVQRAKAYIAKRSELYKQQGFRRARPLTKERSAIEDHGYAYMVDLCLALTPSFIVGTCFYSDYLWYLTSSFINSNVLDHFAFIVGYQFRFDRMVVFAFTWFEFRTFFDRIESCAQK